MSDQVKCLDCGEAALSYSTYCPVHYEGRHGVSPPDCVADDMVNHPPHYTRGPRIGFSDREPFRTLECIEVIRHIKDVRLAAAMKYIWRVAFGGKDNDREDIEKACWYLRDWLENKVE